MPADAFATVASWKNAELAELFAIPLDHVAHRRRDLGRDTWR
jgi:hypothetical protein